jgi:hypothetical protein
VNATVTLQTMVMAFGAVIASAGLVLLFLRKEQAENKIKLLGQEFEISTPALVVFLAGCFVFVMPLVIPIENFDKPMVIISQNREHPTPVPPPDLKKESDIESSSRQGKMGDELSTHQWIFQVRNIRETDEYAERYYQEHRLIRPQGKNDTLIVLDARLKNCLRRTQSPVLTERRPGKTGLIDDAGYSYQPVDYDARQLQDKIQSYEGAPLLSGAVADFALVFSVPRGTKPKLLVFTLSAYDNLFTGTDVQVSLAK